MIIKKNQHEKILKFIKELNIKSFDTKIQS